MKALLLTTTLALFTLFSPAEEANEKSLAAAAKLMDAMRVREEMANGFRTAMEPMLQPMIQQMGLNAEQIAELNAVFTSWWENDVDQEGILKKYQEIYATAFTLQEIEELGLFYQSPLGKKMLLLSPELTQKGMQIGMEAAQAKQAELRAKMEDFEAKVRKENAPEQDESPKEEQPAE